MCRERLEERIPNPLKEGEFVQLYHIKKPSKNYIILESDLQEGNIYPEKLIPLPAWKKTLHVINFENELRDPLLKNQFKFGRGKDADLRIQDVSVSRVHAFIKRDMRDGSFYLQDNQTKFGTLVQVQHPIPLTLGESYWFQHSRSVFEIKVAPADTGYFRRLKSIKL